MAGGVIRVDPEALEELADSCDGIARELEKLGESVFDPSEATMGDGRLAESLNAFYDCWSDRRGVLVEDLRAAAAVLDSVAASFMEADSGLAGSVGGGEQERR